MSENNESILSGNKIKAKKTVSRVKVKDSLTEDENLLNINNSKVVKSISNKKLKTTSKNTNKSNKNSETKTNQVIEVNTIDLEPIIVTEVINEISEVKDLPEAKTTKVKTSLKKISKSPRVKKTKTNSELEEKVDDAIIIDLTDVTHPIVKSNINRAETDFKDDLTNELENIEKAVNTELKANNSIKTQHSNSTNFEKQNEEEKTIVIDLTNINEPIVSTLSNENHTEDDLTNVSENDATEKLVQNLKKAVTKKEKSNVENKDSHKNRKTLNKLIQLHQENEELQNQPDKVIDEVKEFIEIVENINLVFNKPENELKSKLNVAEIKNQNSKNLNLNNNKNLRLSQTQKEDDKFIFDLKSELSEIISYYENNFYLLLPSEKNSSNTFEPQIDLNLKKAKSKKRKKKSNQQNNDNVNVQVNSEKNVDEIKDDKNKQFDLKHNKQSNDFIEKNHNNHFHNNSKNKNDEYVAPLIQIKKESNDAFDKQAISERVTEIISNITFPQLPSEIQLTTDQKLDLIVQKTLSQVEKYLKNEIYVDNTITILVGVSGGVDSVTLLDALALLSEKYYFKVMIAHYNHSLRGADSDADEDFVKELAIKYCFDYFSAKGDVISYSEKNSISIELAARQLRYNFFERTARNHFVDFVATAHTADDSAETFLFNLIRGTGLTGLSGIPATRNFVKNVVIARPLLTLKKKEIIEYAKSRKLKWREDRSNDAVDFTRNKIRKVLIPLIEKEFNPQIVEALNRAAELIYGADQNINQQVIAASQNVLTDIRLERFSLKAQTLQTFDEFMQGEIIQYALNKHLKLPSIPMLTVDAILNLIGKTPGKMIEFQQIYQAVYDRNLLIIGKLGKKVDESADIKIDSSVTIDRFKIKLSTCNINEVKYNPNPKIEFFDLEQLSTKMVFRPWKQGDVFTPLGMNGTMKISDFLINEKIPSVDKPNVMVLANEEEVIWVCGYRINENYKISEKTKKAVKAEFYTL